ncbi:MAG: hypothetical protein HWE08_08440 [Alphaproteobacteria bacterium]|nr:hypothetical protein [Alphaproteobacteria bacterium]
MSTLILGLALGLNAAGSALLDDNPHMMAGDRQFQELIYQNRKVLDEDLHQLHQLSLRHVKHRRASDRAEIMPRQSVH